MRKHILFFALFIIGNIYCQNEKLEPSTSFINQINKINSSVSKIQELIKNEKLQEAEKIINNLPKEINGFEFLYSSDVTKIYENNQAEIKKLKENLTNLKEKIATLNDENKILKSDTNKEIVIFLENFLAKKDLSDKKISELEDENENLNSEKIKLIETKATAKAEIVRLNDSIKVLKKSNLEINEKLNSIYSSVKIGLSIGFNRFVNNELDYIVRADSTVRETGNSSGTSGLISAVIAIRLDKENKHNAIINIPLGDFTSDPTQAVGIFNRRIAVGLGYARRISKDTPNLLLSGSFNISPYEQIDFSEIKDRKFNLQEFTRLDPKNFGSSTNYSYSFTFGIVYTFNNKK